MLEGGFGCGFLCHLVVWGGLWRLRVGSVVCLGVCDVNGSRVGVWLLVWVGSCRVEVGTWVVGCLGLFYERVVMVC